MSKQPPEIAELVLYLMPDASEEEQKEATVNLRAYLEVVYRIFLKFEEEGRLGELQDTEDD